MRVLQKSNNTTGGKSMLADTAPATPPLAGVKVIDIANFLAGPLVSMFLADFGAETIKVTCRA